MTWVEFASFNVYSENINKYLLMPTGSLANVYMRVHPRACTFTHTSWGKVVNNSRQEMIQKQLFLGSRRQILLKICFCSRGNLISLCHFTQTMVQASWCSAAKGRDIRKVLLYYVWGTVQMAWLSVFTTLLWNIQCFYYFCFTVEGTEAQGD